MSLPNSDRQSLAITISGPHNSERANNSVSIEGWNNSVNISDRT